jgi:single-strand DNA-binding protein
MNSTNLIGRLAGEVELRTTPTGKQVASFRLAVPRQRRAGADRGAVFLTVQAWETRAELAARVLRKGDRVGVSGRLDQEEWESTSGRRERVLVVAEELTFLEPRQVEDAPADPEGE